MNNDHLLPEIEILRRMFSYDRETGILKWNKRPPEDFVDEGTCARWNTRFAGKVAGGKNNYGYVRVAINGLRYLAHRIIWLIETGELPDDVNHDNGVHDDNRWVNLKSGTHLDSLKNACKRSDNSSGITGVAWFKALSQWRAYVFISGRQIHLGYFDKIEDAVSARLAAKNAYGFHENHGRENTKTMFTDLSETGQGRMF
jgi:hypothetical protein